MDEPVSYEVFKDSAVRDWLIHTPTEDIVETAYISGISRDGVSELAMSYSLCPIHFVDWAICFDDLNPTCAQVRTIFPESHDT